MNVNEQWYVINTATWVTTVILTLVIAFIVSRCKSVEMRLILIGVFMAVASSAQSSVSVLGPNGVSIGGTAPLMKVATILVLSGVALAALSRQALREETGGTSFSPPGESPRNVA